MIPENTTQSELSRLDKRYRLLLNFQRRIRAMDIQENIAKIPLNRSTWQVERTNVIKGLDKYLCNRGVIIKSTKKPNTNEYKRLYQHYKALPKTIKEHCARHNIPYTKLSIVCGLWEII